MSSIEEIRARFRQQMAETGTSASVLAAQTGEKERTVQSWFGANPGGAPSVEFAAKCEEIGFAAVRWLLCGVEPREPASPDEAATKLQVIGHIVDGQVTYEDVDAIRAMADDFQSAGERLALEDEADDNGNQRGRASG